MLQPQASLHALGQPVVAALPLSLCDGTSYNGLSAGAQLVAALPIKKSRFTDSQIVFASKDLKAV